MSYSEVMALFRATWETVMLGILLMDAVETHGFETVFSATVAATRGDAAPLIALGLPITDAQSMASAVQRAWLGRSKSIALEAIANAKGRA